MKLSAGRWRRIDLLVCPSEVAGAFACAASIAREGKRLRSQWLGGRAELCQRQPVGHVDLCVHRFADVS
jgi:hypothetical protein